MQVSTFGAKLGPVSELIHRIKTQYLFPAVICWLICLHEPEIDYVTSETAGPFPHKFIIRTVEAIKVFGRWTHKVYFFFEYSNFFPTIAKTFAYSRAQKNLSGFSANA